MISIFSIGRLHWMHWSVIAISLLLTIAAWKNSSSEIEHNKKQRFDFLSSQLLERITKRMSRYEDALYTGVVVIQTQNGKIDSKDWKRFSKALKLESMYPGVNGIGVIFHVPPEKLDDFIKEERNQRLDFHIHPLHDKNEYWPITYIEPIRGNEQAVGLDMAFEKNRLLAAKQARDTSEVQITKPIILVQDAKKSPGFLQFVPFYNSHDIATKEQRRKHFVGHVYAPFIMQKLITGVLDQDNRHVIFSIYDGDQRLYDELNSDNSDYKSTPLYSNKVIVKMYNRPWTFTIQTGASFDQVVSNNQSDYILLGGIVINILLVLLFVMLSGRNLRSLVLVDEMTKKVIAGEEYFRHIIEAAPCGMIITNNKGIIENVNPQAELLFGYNKKELLGHPIDMLVPQIFHEVHSADSDDSYKNKSHRRLGLDENVHGLKRNGDEFSAEIELAYFEGDDGPKILSTIVDMTDNVAMTDELKRSNKDLNDFAYVASHDLKAPLRGIMQLASWIEEDIEGNASDETKKHLKLLQNRTARLEKLLDDLLTYSRIGHHREEVEEVDVLEMVQALYNLLVPPVGFSLNIIEPLPVLITLSTPLDVIFRNLIGNAIKHHDKPDGIISISVIEYNKYYEFSVTNDGPGIDFKHHDKIFEMFQTLRPRDEVEGSGMGLSIIKRMLESHGGYIKVTSDGERGVSFIFSWPKNFSHKEKKNG
jgi:PAS domain S-box-containing protein